MKRALLVGALAVLLFHAAPSMAQQAATGEAPSQRTMAAEELFRAGRQLITQHRYGEACEKLKASEKIDPAVGTMVSLGECNAGLGHTASAWLAYRRAIALATERHDPRKAGIEERAAAIEPQVSNVVIHLSGDVRTPSPEITIDGESFSHEIVGSPIPMDPGAHSIVATASGYRPWSGQVRVEKLGDTITVDVPPLEPLPDATSVLAERRAVATRRTVGLVVGGVGLVGLAVGFVLGGQAIVKIRDANELCPGATTCSNASAVHENQVGKTYAIASSVVVPASALVLGVGTFLFFTAHGPRGTEVAGEAIPGGARLRMGWSW